MSFRRKSTDPWWRRFQQLPPEDAARVLYLDESWTRQTMGVLYAGAWGGLAPWQIESSIQGELDDGGGLSPSWYGLVTPNVRAIQVLWLGGRGLSMPRSVFVRNCHLWWKPISDEILVVDIDGQDWVLAIDHEGGFRSMRRARFA